MAIDTFDGAADTNILAHNAAWNAGLPGAGLELNGNGALRNENVFVEGRAYYTGAANDVTVTLPVDFQSGATQNAGPGIHMSGAQEGYAAYIITSGTTITQVRLWRSGTGVRTFFEFNLPEPTNVTSTLGVNITIRLYLDGSDVTIVVSDGTNSDIYTWTDGAPLTGGEGGVSMGAHGSAGVVIEQFEDGAGAVVNPGLRFRCWTDQAGTVQATGTKEFVVDVSVGGAELHQESVLLSGGIAEIDDDAVGNPGDQVIVHGPELPDTLMVVVDLTTADESA